MPRYLVWLPDIRPLTHTSPYWAKVSAGDALRRLPPSISSRSLLAFPSALPRGRRESRRRRALASSFRSGGHLALSVCAPPRAAFVCLPLPATVRKEETLAISTPSLPCLSGQKKKNIIRKRPLQSDDYIGEEFREKRASRKCPKNCPSALFPTGR